MKKARELRKTLVVSSIALSLTFYFTHFAFSTSATLTIADDCKRPSDIEFDISLGQGDTYFGKFYLDCMSSLAKQDSIWALLVGNRPIDPLVKLCKELYEKNRDSSIGIMPRIPLKIHQIWLGSPVPEKYLKWQKTWQSIPGFTYKLWTDDDVNEFNFAVKDIYNKAKNYGQRADILRIAILDKEGGIYVDIDFECIKPEFFKMLNFTYDFYAGLHPLDAQVFALENALIGSIPGHPILKAYLRDLPKRWALPSATQYSEVVIKTGPGLFTRAFYKEAGKYYKDIALPPTFLYPLGLAQWDYLRRYGYEKVKEQVLKTESAAIHWWHGSWKAREAYVEIRRSTLKKTRKRH